MQGLNLLAKPQANYCHFFDLWKLLLLSSHGKTTAVPCMDSTFAQFLKQKANPLEGWLKIKVHRLLVDSWRKRWFKLRKDHKLYYYNRRASADAANHSPVGFLDLHRSFHLTTTVSKNSWILHIATHDSTFHLQV